MIRAALLASIVIVIGGGFGNYLRYSEHSLGRGPDFSQLPYEHPGFISEERRFSDASYEVLQADTSTLRLVRDTVGNASWLFVAYFGSQQYGHQIHSPRHCLPGGGWTIRRHEIIPLDLGTGEMSVNRLLIDHDDKQQVMFYWFLTRSGAVAGEFDLKLDMMKNSLLLMPTDAAMIRLTTPLDSNDLNTTTERTVGLLKTIYPDLMRSLPFNS